MHLSHVALIGCSRKPTTFLTGHVNKSIVDFSRYSCIQQAAMVLKLEMESRQDSASVSG